MSIRALEKENATFMDMGDDQTDEYGIRLEDTKWVF